MRLRWEPLFLVAVPIGNPDDLGPRAREMLRRRRRSWPPRTRGTSPRWRATTARRRVRSATTTTTRPRARRELLGRLRAGEDVALVSDAGTPLDQRSGLPAGARGDRGRRSRSPAFPGPSAVTTALAASGPAAASVPIPRLPARTAAARRAALEDVSGDEATLIAFEAPRRLLATLRDALDGARRRPACLARNLTKPHERYQRGTAVRPARRARGGGRGPRRGTLVIGGAPTTAPRRRSDAEADARLLARRRRAGARRAGAARVQRHGLAEAGRLRPRARACRDR